MTGTDGFREGRNDEPGAGLKRPIPEPLDFYRRMHDRVTGVRDALARPMTLAEKVLGSHLSPGQAPDLRRGHSYADLDPDRVALQDALAQIVALQFMTAGLDEVVVPTTVHCDHLIRAKTNADADLRTALGENAEVYDFLRSVCDRYGIGFWEPGSGIIHQVVLENYAFPGGMMIGTDSHTPNAGGLGMIAVGVGGGDAIDVMTGLRVQPAVAEADRRPPDRLSFRLVVTEGRHPARGGDPERERRDRRDHRVLRSRARSRSARPGRRPSATWAPRSERPPRCSVTTRTSPPTCAATGRGDWAGAADLSGRDLRCDPEVERDPGRFFDQIVEIDLSQLTPLINGPDTPDLVHRVGEVGSWARDHGVPTAISAALVGSCTNSSYEDIARAASVARQASAAGLKARSSLLVTPGSEQIRATIERDGLLGDLEAIGATVLANACGPCIGQWDRQGPDTAEPNTIVTSFNRNFSKRNDGNAATKAFVTSPEMVVAYALAGTLDFDPLTDELPGSAPDRGAGAGAFAGAVAGVRGIRFGIPTGDVLPPLGFDRRAPLTTDAVARPGAVVSVAPGSERLQLLEPFPAWDGKDYVAMPVLMKAKGKCTTDHISAAGRWLTYRGHLENISGNLFLGVTNAFTGAVGEGKDPTDGATRPYPEIAKHLSDAGGPMVRGR